MYYPPAFTPDIAMHIVKIACEMPHLRGRSLSQWDCSKIARELVRSGVVSSISAESVRRILSSQKLKPWRHHMWLSPKILTANKFHKKIRPNFI